MVTKLLSNCTDPLSSPLKPSSGELAAMAAALTGGDGECAGGQSMGVK